MRHQKNSARLCRWPLQPPPLPTDAFSSPFSPFAFFFLFVCLQGFLHFASLFPATFLCWTLGCWSLGGKEAVGGLGRASPRSPTCRPLFSYFFFFLCRARSCRPANPARPPVPRIQKENNRRQKKKRKTARVRRPLASRRHTHAASASSFFCFRQRPRDWVGRSAPAKEATPTRIHPTLNREGKKVEQKKGDRATAGPPVAPFLFLFFLNFFPGSPPPPSSTQKSCSTHPRLAPQ